MNTIKMGVVTGTVTIVVGSHVNSGIPSILGIQ